MTNPTPASAVSATGAAEISHEEFLLHLTSMQRQYRSINPAGQRPVSAYVLPAYVVARLPATLQLAASRPSLEVTPASGGIRAHLSAQVAATGISEAASSALVDALEEQHRVMLAHITSCRDSTMQVINAAQQSASTGDFIQRMEALQAKEKADHEARIDAFYDRLTSLGTRHPAARPAVLHAGNKVGGFAAGIADEVMGLGNTIKTALGAGAAAVGKAAESVGHWASGAAASVGHFFKSIF